MAIPPLIRDVDALLPPQTSFENVDTSNLKLLVPLSALSHMPVSNNASARESITSNLSHSNCHPTPEEEVKSGRTKIVLEMGYVGVKDVRVEMRVVPQAVSAAAFAVSGVDFGEVDGVRR